MNDVKKLYEALTAVDVVSSIRKLESEGVISNSFPEINSIVILDDLNGKHKNVWTHTLQVVASVPNVLELRFAALLHDIGKSKTRRVWSNGRVTFHGHEIVSSAMTMKLDKRVDLFAGDAALRNEVNLLVENHLRPAQYNQTWTDSAIRRLISELTIPGVERLLCLSRADLSTKNEKKIARARKNADSLEERIKQIIAIDNAPKLAKGTMSIVISSVNEPPGPWLKRAQVAAEKAMIDGIIPRNATSQECADYILKNILNSV